MADQIDAEMMAAVDGMAKARAAITDKHGTRKPPGDICGVFDPCPVCDTGTLMYRISHYNGHIAAACTHLDCVSFRE